MSRHGWRRLAIAVTCAALAGGRAAPADALAVDGDVAFAEGPVLHLIAHNDEQRPLERVVPEATFQHREITGDAITLAPGDRHEWRLTLPSPPEPGTFAAVTRVRYADPAGAALETPLVTLVSTPGAQASPVRIVLATEPGPGYTDAHLQIDNPDVRPIAARVIFVLPRALRTEPESQAVAVPAGGQRVVPFAVEARSARPDVRYPVFGILEYEGDGVHYAVLARTETTVPVGAAPRAIPLAIGGAALLTALGLLAFAWRRAAARAA